MTRITLFSLCSLVFLAACAEVELEQNAPKDHRDTRRENRGSLTGDGGLFSLGGGGRDEAAKGSPLGVNSFLWRATLDTLSFMPLASADPFGGVIITDWYEDPQTPGERYKANALILDKTLRADGIRVTIFKQRMEGGNWRDLPVDERLGRKLEDTILTRARELRIAQTDR